MRRNHDDGDTERLRRRVDDQQVVLLGHVLALPAGDPAVPRGDRLHGLRLGGMDVHLEGWDAADDQREKISTNDTEDAADRRADQPLQAHGAQAPFENNDRAADQDADDGIQVRGQIKRSNAVADKPDKQNKQKAYKYDVHG